MVDQPAYLKNLKAYARTQYGDEGLIDDIVADLSAESDRGAIILAATSIEDTLEYALGMRMSALESDVTARGEVFGAHGCIGTYSAKILMAYAMGIIDKETRKVIDLVREIRNACAHSRRPITLQEPSLSTAVKVAIGEPMLSEIKDHEPHTLRLAFIVRCGQLAIRASIGKLQSPHEIASEYQQRHAQDDGPSP